MDLALDQFQARLLASGLLTAVELAALVDSLPVQERPQTGAELARLLLRRKQLTTYQAQAIASGHGRSLVLGNYVLLDKLGQGGMGTVYKARHVRMQRVVALKLLSPEVTKDTEAVRRFQREAVAAARLLHPNIVTAYDANQDRETHFLVMEYVAGRDLAALVRDAGTLSVPQAVWCILQAAQGLQYAHEQGIVHRDVKPSNLLLDSSGIVKVLDLGLARLDFHGRSRHGELTSTGMVLGTVAYMSPEQAESTKSADARSDVYSLGMTLWYLLTGRPCFDADSAAGVILAHQQASIPSLVEARPDAPPALETIFRKLAAKHPADRFQSMAEVIAALGPLLGPEPAAMDVASVQRSLATRLSDRADQSEPTLDFSSWVNDETQFAVTTAQQEAQPLSPPPREERRERTPWALVAAFLGGAGMILLTMFFVLSGQRGNVSIEVTDPEVEFSIDKGAVTIVGTVKRKVSLSPGEHELSVKRGDAELPPEKLVVGRGVPIAILVEVVDGTLRLQQDGRIIAQVPLPAEGAAGAAVLLSAAPLLEFSPGGRVEVASLRIDPAGPFTLEAYVTPDKTGENEAALLLGVPRQFALRLAPRSNLLFLELHYPQSEMRVDAAPLAARRRTHVAVVCDGGQIRLYSAGILVAFEKIPLPLENSAAPFTIGDQFAGWLEEVRVSKVARYSNNFTPATRIDPDGDTLALYRADEGQGQKLTDSSGQGHDGNISSARWSKAKTVPGPQPEAPPPHEDYALSFDGQANIVELPSLHYDPHQPLTVEAWFHKRIAREDVLVSPIVLVLGNDEPGQIVQLVSNYNGGATARLDLPGLVKPAIPGFRTYTHREPLPERRNHLAACLSADHKLSLFVNGKLSKGYYQGEGSQRPAFPGAFLGGSREPGEDRISRCINGTLDEVRVSRVVRYEGDFEPEARFVPDGDTLALYHCDEGRGIVLQDVSGHNHHGKIVGAKWVPADVLSVSQR